MSDAATSKHKKSALKGKGGLVMLAAVAALAVWLGFDLKKPVREADAPPPVTDYVPLAAADVQRVELKRARDPFTLVRAGGKWRFEQPGKLRANTDTVDTWLKSLLDDAKTSRAVEGKPADLASYGLDKPVAELVLAPKSGQSRTLQIGKDFRPGGASPPGSMYYAREARDGRLFMVDAQLAKDLSDKQIESLRDKRLVEISEPKDVQKIVLQRPSGTVEVRRQGEEKWTLAQPFNAPAEKADVDSLLDQIKSAQADSIVDKPEDLAKYGLDRPRLTLQVTDKKGTRQVQFGNATSDRKVYAYRPEDREVALVQNFTFDNFNKTPADLRERKLVTLDGEKINHIELRNPNGTIRLQKTGGNDWRLLEAAGGKGSKAKADSVQRIIDSARAPAFKHVEEAPKDLARYGLDQPVITVTLGDGRTQNQVLTLGKKTKDGTCYARGLPNAVFEVQSFTFTDFNVKPDFFKDTTPTKK